MSVNSQALENLKTNVSHSTIYLLLRSKQTVRSHFIIDLLCHGSLSDDKNTQLSHVRQRIKQKRYEESKRGLKRLIY
jgi:hypothetical protein